MVAKELKLMALAEGIRIHQNIDDWLMRAKTQFFSRDVVGNTLQSVCIL